MSRSGMVAEHRVWVTLPFLLLGAAGLVAGVQYDHLGVVLVATAIIIVDAILEIAYLNGWLHR